MLLSLFVQLYRNNEKTSLPEETAGEGKRTEYIMKALCYIRSHLCEPIALDDICRDVAMSRYYFCHLFRAFTGMTVINYINMLRCSLARSLILEKRFNVSETAKYLGISNLSYFGQMYKKYMGVLPSRESVKDVPELSRMDPMTFEGKNKVHGILRYGVTFAPFYRT
jgi:AraC-like DNA-binding protein